MKTIAIVDYGLGNLFSIKQALEAVGAHVLITSESHKILNADGVLLPGVGAFGDAMERLRERKLIEVIETCAKQGKPILGVCLGLQLLFEKSHEFGTHEGLGLIPGEVLKFPEVHNGITLNVPFIGWNKLCITDYGRNSKLSILSELSDMTKIYFVHSFYVSPRGEAEVLAFCQYQGFAFPAVVMYKNIIGIQGHPEKSSENGLKIYQKWVKSL